jgi:hypothetical protein
MIICFTHDQAVLLSEIDSVEVDMSFKRVKAKEMKEVVFAKYMTSQSKGKLYSLLLDQTLKKRIVMTFCRVYTTADTREGYYLLFKRVFDRIATIIRRRVSFRPIDGRGIQAVVMDMDTKQYSGKLF